MVSKIPYKVSKIPYKVSKMVFERVDGMEENI